MPESTLHGITPPATIGILGGGQLGRMLALAARSLGYRVAVLDPDPDCPAAAVAERVERGGYDDAPAARRLAAAADVVTFELEHIDARIVEAITDLVPVRPGPGPLRVTQDRLAERRFLEGCGVAVAPWFEVAAGDEAALAAAAASLGLPVRLKAPFGGYDGRSQVRIAGPADLPGAHEGLRRPAGSPLLVEAELTFTAELSVVCARGVDGALEAFPPVANRHAGGILAESVLPADLPPSLAADAVALAGRLAAAMDLVGILTVELFLLPDGSLVVNELAPRVHNSGHATAEACATSQFEQHVRAICGLPLGSPALRSPAAMVNLLGAGPRRPAHLEGIPAALADPGVHLHLYDKREVFERRKMGHLVVADSDPARALGRARIAQARLRWADDPGDGLGSPHADG